jgi:hypothetical protein
MGPSFGFPSLFPPVTPALSEPGLDYELNLSKMNATKESLRRREKQHLLTAAILRLFEV